MPYCLLYYHLVWSTKRKYPLITPDLEPAIYNAISQKCEDMGGTLYAIGGMVDHVHLLVSIPPTIPVAEFVSRVKGFSSHQAGDEFQWQAEYAAFSVSKRSLSAIIGYIQNQQKHHRQGLIYPNYEPPDEG
jgi:putative transposase